MASQGPLRGPAARRRSGTAHGGVNGRPRSQPGLSPRRPGGLGWWALLIGPPGS